MKSLDEFLREADPDGDLRSGMVLGIRLAMLGLREVGIHDPRARRRTFVTIVETDRCLPDAIELVTGCRLGNRTLKFKDFGKMAATIVDLSTSSAVRVAARESANQAAVSTFSDVEHEDALRSAYRLFSDQDLFCLERGFVEISPQDAPGYRAQRFICDLCGEGVGLNRIVVINEQNLCGACGGTSYFLPTRGIARSGLATQWTAN